jgi:hypothetical protein
MPNQFRVVTEHMHARGRSNGSSQLLRASLPSSACKPPQFNGDSSACDRESVCASAHAKRQRVRKRHVSVHMARNPRCSLERWDLVVQTLQAQE